MTNFTDTPLFRTVVDVKDNKFVLESGADQVRIEFEKWALSTNETAAKRAKEQQKKIDRRDEIDELLPKKNKERDDLINSISENDKTLSGNNATLISLKERIDELVKKLKYESEK